jgi:hypothetical protein
MAPAQSLDDPPRFALWPIAVGLENAAPLSEMPFGMFAGAVARGVEQHRRRSLSAEGEVVADIDPDATRVGPRTRSSGRTAALRGRSRSPRPYDVTRMFLPFRFDGQAPAKERTAALLAL